jgi:Na+-transporting NADH:ubiquinone oxidoreductase subunit A
MSKVIKIRKGLNIKLLGAAEKCIKNLPAAAEYGVVPTDFEGLNLKLLVREGEQVEAGQALFADKKQPDIVAVTPVSGTIKAVNRGERRMVESVVIKADKVLKYKQLHLPKNITKESATKLLLESGLWPSIIQRPYGIIANPADAPKAIFVSGFDTAPLAPDMAYALTDSYLDLKKGFEILSKLTVGKVHLSLNAKSPQGVFDAIGNVEKHYFEGPHPTGNVGVQIAKIDPINKGDIVWTIDIQQVTLIGRLFNTGRVDMTKVYAVAGPEVSEPCYVRALAGTPVAEMVKAAGGVKENPRARARYISGNALSGEDVGERGYMGFYADQLTMIPEGDRHEMLGWAMPRFGKFSVSRTYFSWLQPGKKYVLDTNLHGGHRPFIVTGLFEKYMPMDIYPMQLLKAIVAQDIDKMEALGIYEVVPEDFALCEFADPSKNEIQKIVRDGINLIIKEM